MEKEINSEKIAGGIQAAGTALAVFSLVKLIVIVIVLIGIIIFFIVKGLPWYVGLISISFVVLLVVFQAIKIKRISSVKLTPPSPPLRTFKTIETEPDEKIVDYITGIMRVGILPEGKIYGKGWLGVGEINFPENALILTNYRVAFIKVPVAGAGKLIADTNISMWQWILAKKDIENKLKEMMASQSLQEILNCSEKNFSLRFEEIKEIKLSKISQSIIFISKDNKKYEYSIRDKKDFEKAKVIFKRFLLE